MTTSATNINQQLTTWGLFPAIATVTTTGLSYFGKVYTPVGNPLTASFPAISTLTALTTLASTGLDILLANVKLTATIANTIFIKALNVAASATLLSLVNNYVVVKYIPKNFGPISPSTTAAVALIVFLVKAAPALWAMLPPLKVNVNTVPAAPAAPQQDPVPAPAPAPVNGSATATAE